MQVAIIISQTDPETVFNALRFAVFALGKGDPTQVFLIGKGVEIESIQDARFDIRGQIDAFAESGGQFLACGTCLKLREQAETEVCPVSTMADLYDLVNEADRVLTF